MVRTPRPEETWSFRNGRITLEEKDLITDLSTIAEAYQRYGGGNQNLADREQLMGSLGWEQELSARFEATNDQYSRRGNFDAYKDGVLLEHESGEQMRANWHLMKMEAVNRDPESFDECDSIDAGVLLIPDYVNFPTLGRTETDVQAFLANYFDFCLPLFVWQYPTED